MALQSVPASFQRVTELSIIGTGDFPRNVWTLCTRSRHKLAGRSEDTVLPIGERRKRAIKRAEGNEGRVVCPGPYSSSHSLVLSCVTGGC